MSALEDMWNGTNKTKNKFNDQVNIYYFNRLSYVIKSIHI